MDINIENLHTLGVDALNAISNDLDRQRNQIMQLKRLVHDVRVRRLEAENAAVHGLTVEDYRKAREFAATNNVPLTKVLAANRKRAVQIAKANVAIVGSQAAGANPSSQK